MSRPPPTRRSLVCAALTLATSVLGCGSAGPAPVAAPPSAQQVTPTSSALFTIEDGSIGPITATTPATAEALGALLGARYEIREVDRGGIELQVFLRDELLFYVIPNDDGSLFNVHVVSAKIEIAQHPEWRIGAAFTSDDLLTACECWGDSPVCFRKGDHVAVAFARPGCEVAQYADPRLRRVLEGVRVQRAVWSPTPFGSDGGVRGLDQSLPDWIPRDDP